MYFFIRKMLILLLCISAGQAQQFSLRTSIHGYESGMTVAPGIYKTYINGFLCFRKLTSTPIFNPRHESALYAWLLAKSLTPRYIVVQATAYPTAMTSSYLETYHPGEFFNLKLNGWNWLRSIGSNAEEPHAFSLLVGNFAFLGYREQIGDGKERIRQSGSGMAGLLLTTGQWHIQDNIRINDRWWQAEIILTGLLNEPHVRKMLWNFRAGVKVHDNPLLQDVVLISLFRDHTNWRGWNWSLDRNSVINYEAQFPLKRNWRHGYVLLRQYLTYGKKWPLTIAQRQMAVRISGGILWEVVRKYNHDQRYFETSDQRQIIWIVQPGVEF
jgi:hypothetical protein